MSVFEINKIVGALLTAALVIMVISIIGDTLVSPKQHKAAAVSVRSTPAASAAKPEKEPPLAQLLAAADAGAGKKVFNKCKSCHTTAKGGKHKIGPNLWDTVGSKKAAAAGFKYSGPLKGLGGNWSYADLNAFLKSPKSFVKGTKMTFAGVKKAADRANLILYLRSLSGAPKKLP